MPPKTVVVGHPVMQSMSSDIRHLVFVLADMPTDPVDCVVGLFSRVTKPVKWAAMKNLRVAVIDLKQGTATVHPLPASVEPRELHAMGGGGFTLNCTPLSGGSDEDWTLVYAFPGEPMRTLKSKGWVDCTADPLVPQFVARDVPNGSAMLFRPGVAPIKLAGIDGMAVQLAGGRVFVRSIEGFQIPARVGTPRGPSFFEVNPMTGQRIPFSEEAFRKLENPVGQELDLSRVVTFESREQKRGVGLLFELVAKSEDREIIVERDLTDGIGIYPLMPVMLVKGDAVMLREVREVTTGWAGSLRAAPAKQEAMSQAKQVAVAILIYAADYDGMSPSGADWKEKLMPYTKNADLLKDFVLMLPGVNLDKVQKPAETVLGIVTTVHGTAVAYVDGHVVWKG